MSKKDLGVKVVLSEGAIAPSYETQGAAGADVRAYLPDGDIILEPGEYKLIPTGLKLEIPVGYEIQVRPRSGLAIKKGITVLNSPGTIDSDYRGEVKVILINHSKEPFVITNGDRIAQFVFAQAMQADFQSVETLSGTNRGSGGFGSTGV